MSSPKADYRINLESKSCLANLGDNQIVSRCSSQEDLALDIVYCSILHDSALSEFLGRSFSFMHHTPSGFLEGAL